MKIVEKLGISPLPWSVYEGERGNDGYFASVRDGEGLAVHYSDDTYTSAPYLDANARLIAAAPELYECLRDAVNNECRPCEANVYGVCKDIDSSDDDVLCFVKRWRKALAKAGGEEAAK